MNKVFEKELINFYLTSKRYRIYELERDYEGATIWMLQGSFDVVNELVAFVNCSNFSHAKEKLEQYINETYVGTKALNVCFVVIGTTGEELISRDNTALYSDFVAGTSMIQIDIDNNEIAQVIGDSFAIQIAAKFVDYKKNEKSAASKASVLTLTNVIIVIDILVFAVMVLSTGNVLGNILDVNIYTLRDFGAMSNTLIRLGEYYRLITPIFLHAGLLHIALNMYALKSLGSLIERIYGTAKFALIYFISGLMGSIFSFALSGASISVGASGAIFGLLGSAAVYGFKMKNRIGRNFLSSVFQVIFINLLIGFSVSYIDNSAHIGGLVGGLLTTAIIELSRKEE